MTSDEMVEKARAHLVAAGYKETGGGAWLSEGYVLEDPTGEMASFARSAVRDAVRECTEGFFMPYFNNSDSDGVCASCHHYCPSRTRMLHFEGCAASALRKKFEVGE